MIRALALWVGWAVWPFGGFAQVPDTNRVVLDVYVSDAGVEPVANARMRLLPNGNWLGSTGPAGTLLLTLNAPDLASQPLQEGRYVLNLQVVAFGYDTLERRVSLRPGQTRRLSLNLEPISLADVVVQGSIANQQDPDNPFVENLPIEARDIRNMPTPLSSIERVISDIAGGTTSEFSSQYRIRGGNFDENLIYINGVEIYRPLLIRAGTQEGLPITNSNLAEDVRYSTGGFQARYGDKLSSVLDIDYRTPTRFAASAELGLLNQSIDVEGVLKGRERTRAVSMGNEWVLQPSPRQPGQFSFLVGARRFSLSPLLNTLDTQGEYEPTSWDVQSLLSYTPGSRTGRYRLHTGFDSLPDTLYRPPTPLRISWLNIVSSNDFRFTPTTRETTFGTIQQAFRLLVGFLGTERTRYLSTQSALVVDHKPSYRLTFKYILSAYRSDESELFDVEGGYRLGDVSTSLGNADYNEITFVRGVGSELRFARNFLTFYVAFAEAKGEWVLDRNLYRKTLGDRVRHRLLFGARLQQEWVYDRIKEWSVADSADFITPFAPTEAIVGNNALVSQRAMGYVQYSWRTGTTTQLMLGTRAHYWTQNDQLTLSPRIQFVIDPPLNQKNSRDLLLRFGVGMYHQPPFYRELRNLDGSLVPDVPAQTSVHVVAGTDYVFQLFRRPFKLFGEVYYKHLENLVPYEYENVRIRYYPNETARGFAYGADAKINGQFIPGIESWFRLSFLDTREDVASTPAGLVRRPSDQRITFSMFFQDHLPRLKALKAHVNLQYGTGLPFGPPRVLQNRTAFQAPNYLRVDFGLSYELLFRPRNLQPRAVRVRSLWLGLQVFNLLQRENTISYQWVNDLYGNRFAIPNYLSTRFLNLRAIIHL